MNRPNVLWIGDRAPAHAAAAFSTRRLSLNQVTTPQLSDYNTARAVVINIQRTRDRSMPALDFIDTCLTHGFRPIIRCPAFASLNVQAKLASRTARYDLRDAALTIEDFAELARQLGTEPGMPLNSTLKVIGALLKPEDDALLRRAFSDCSHVYLHRLDDGKSYADVFRAHVRFDRMASNVGAGDAPLMLPFLLKFDDRAAIDSECKNIHKFVLPHVPFSQRPNIDQERSLLGADRGILVCDFVEEAVPLAKLCDQSIGRGAIYSLFDDAMKSWRRHAVGDQTPTGGFPELMPDLIREGAIDVDIRSRAAKFGLLAEPEQLVARLAVASRFNFRLGTIHGDLHPGNVMVRNGEAILIDFANIWERAPLIADLACLEVAICFTVAPEKLVLVKSGDENFERWAKAIDFVFDGTCLRQVPPLQEAPDDINWLSAACRQTRNMAPQVGADPKHYAAALVAYLLRRARLGGRAGENKEVAAYALYIAEKVLIYLEPEF